MIHAARGTCRPGCPDYGRCHCKCGEATTIAEKTNRAMARTAGEPAIWRSGHNRPRPITPRGRLSRTGVPIEGELGRLLDWLNQRYSARKIAELAGIPEGTLANYLWRRTRYASPDNARRIIDLVLEHRRAPATFTDYETEARTISDAERDAVRREHNARIRQNYRGQKEIAAPTKQAMGRGHIYPPRFAEARR